MITWILASVGSTILFSGIIVAIILNKKLFNKEDLKELKTYLTSQEGQEAVTRFIFADAALLLKVQYYFVPDNAHFYLAVTSAVLSKIGLVCAFIIIYNSFDWKYKEPKWVYRLGTALIVTLMVILNTIVWFNIGPKQTKTIEPNTLYVTYNPECVYCEVAKPKLTRAIRVYNYMKSNDIEFVDISEDTPLAKELKKHIKHSGSVVYVQENKNYITSYTRGDINEKPIAMKEYEYYQLFQDVMTHVNTKE